jgi:formylglycine-generating enzyme required for sulfatase activity
VLRRQQQEWGLTDAAAETIITSVLEPFRRRLANLERWRTALQQEVERQFPLAPHLEADLRDWQRQVLGLADEDVAAITAPILAQAEARLEARRQEAAQRQPAAAPPRQPEAERRQQPQEERLRPQEAAARLNQPPAADRARPPTQPPENMRRRQVLRWAGFGGIGLLVTGLAAWVRGLLGGSPSEPISKPSEPISKPSEPVNRPSEPVSKPSETITVAKPKYTPPDAASALWTVDFETVTVDERGENPQRAAQSATLVKEDLGNDLSLELVVIPTGPFTMGSPAGEKDRNADEGPPRRVNVSAFAMGQYAVTQAQYQAIMDKNPARFEGANRPVETVSWAEAVEFCARLSKRTGRTYDLPSEAEWEYAGRAGTTTPFHFGATLTTALANYDGNDIYRAEARGQYRRQTVEVGQFPPNAWGLYDMHGNVWEWCLDHYHNSYQGAPPDARAWVTNDQDASRLLRGGSWVNYPANCRSARRNHYIPASRNDRVGFRVVLRPA